MMFCPKFGFEVTSDFKQSYCLNCADKCEIVKPTFNLLGKVDVFELARLLAEKQKNKNKAS